MLVGWAEPLTPDLVFANWGRKIKVVLIHQNLSSFIFLFGIIFSGIIALLKAHNSKLFLIQYIISLFHYLPWWGHIFPLILHQWLSVLMSFKISSHHTSCLFFIRVYAALWVTHLEWWVVPFTQFLKGWYLRFFFLFSLTLPILFCRRTFASLHMLSQLQRALLFSTLQISNLFL